MDAITLEALEYDGLKRLIGRRLKSPLGRIALEALTPSSNRDEVSVRRRRAVEALAFLREFHPPGPGQAEDPREILHEVEPEGSIPDGARVARLMAVMRVGLSWRDEIAAVRTRYPRIWEVAGSVPNLRTLLNDLAGKVTAEGRLEDRASRKLSEIRGRLATLEGRLQRTLKQYLERETVRDAVQDEFVTVRNSRFVVPIKVEARKGIAGIIHGSSSTGATVYVEPLEIVESNNELVTLREEEEAECRRILLEIGSRLRSSLPELRALRRVLGEGDLLGACAEMAESHGCVPAADAEELVLEGARHPVLEAALKERNESIVPLDVEVPGRSRALVLSGPNTGGKTVSMKTIGLLALMNQSGLLVPAKNASLPVFARVLADVGDRQSITENLSTFSARMLRVAEMSRSLKSPSLVLLDEVGGGTDPEEEGALAVAIVEHFHRGGAWVIATTHHGTLKAWAEVTEGATNASMEFNEEELEPTHRLIPGIAGRSGGLEMAQRFGLPREILNEARGRLSDSHRMVDQYLSTLQGQVEDRRVETERAREERKRAAREGEQARARAMEAERSLRERYEKTLAEALETIGGAADGLEKNLKDRAAALQLRSEARKEARKIKEKVAASLPPPEPVHIKAPIPAEPGEELSSVAALEPGAKVMVRTLGAEGVIQSINQRKGKADLLIRGKKMTVSLSDCEPAAAGAAPKPRVPVSLPSGVTLETSGKECVSPELKIIGQRVDEALGVVEKFLDDAILAGHKEVRIVHGHGTGRLRKAVLALLSDHELVENHRQADPKAGGAGATIAVLKD